jgi:hypothetical protein
MTFRAPVFAVLLALLAACSGSEILSVSNYDTSCKQDSDCVAVFVGQYGCCRCPNAAIDASDEAQYQADVAAAASQYGVCDVACPACPDAVVAACVAGKCGVTEPSGTCGATPCDGG